MKTYGLSAEMVKKLTDKFTMNVIYDYNKLDYNAAPGSTFEAGFNTPEHNLKAGILEILTSLVLICQVAIHLNTIMKLLL